MFKLFYFPMSCSLASHIALEEAGAVFEAIKVDFYTNEQRKAEYMTINPKGRVPALVTDEGILTENPAILSYIAMRFPEAKLAPLDDPFKLAKLQSFNAYLSSTVQVAHAHGLRGPRWADQQSSYEDMRQRVSGNMAECFQLIEDELLEGPWVMGETFSIADAYLFTFSTWLEGDGVDASQFDKVSQHMAAMLQRPCVQRAMAREQEQ
jgi:glutathione S-transferase